MAIALTAHPLSAAYKDELERSLGVELEYVSLSHLRRRPPREVARTFKSLQRQMCFVPLEDDGSRALLPVLEAVAMLLRPRSVELVDADLRRTKVSRLSALPSFAALAWATLDGRAAVRRSAREIDELKHAERAPANFDGPRHVIHLNGNLWFGVKAGGSVGHIAGVINGFADRGYDATLVAAAPLPAALRDAVHQRPFSTPTAFGIPPEVNTFRAQGRIGEHAIAVGRAEPPGLIYHRLSLATHAGVLAARALSAPFAVEYNGSEAWVQRNWGRPLRYERLALDAEAVTLAHAHVVVTVSEVLRGELVERGVEPRRIVCYPNCVDPVVFDPARFADADRVTLRARHGIPANAVVITFIGTFGQWHGVDVLARAIRRLSEERPEWIESRRVHFMLVGDGVLMPTVEEVLGTFRKFTTLTGLVRQVEAPAYLAASDVLLSPHVPNTDGTRFFGSPTKLFEYMAMERPIVASRLDQIADVLDPGLDAASLPSDDAPAGDALAVLARPGDVDELIAGITFLAERPSWRALLGENARRRALARYTWHHHVDAILDGVEAVSSGRT